VSENAAEIHIHV